MSEVVIKVENLGKKYLISHLADKREQLFSRLLANKAKDLLHRGKKIFSPFTINDSLITDSQEEFWALKDVSFEIKQGDRVGIIGRNGAGKSTLLKVLSRITEPTKGRISLDGRVASLLEVGTGFHSELSGRENIYLNGAILGMSREEIKRKFDEIVAFAEVEQFLDTPVKRYSSGMYVRLAFAVAAHLEPEILIVDEVLAVGDAVFQKKCLGKMEDVSTKEGRTVLFVSHNMEAIQKLCSTSLLLQSGKLIDLGSTNEVISKYIDRYSEYKTYQEWKDLAKAPGNDKAILVKAMVKSLDSSDDNIFMDTPFEFEFIFCNQLSGENNLDVTYHLIDERGILVYVGSTVYSKHELFGPGLIRAKCTVPGNLLNEGVYTVSRLLIVKDKGTVVYECKDVLTFGISNSGTGQLGWVGQKEGVIKPKLEWQIIAENTDQNL
jgi:lipopolysaccharide transport system ATP-binding protein